MFDQHFKQQVLDFIRESERRMREIADNQHFAAEQINNANFRLAQIESILVPAKAKSGTVTFGGKMDIQVHISDKPQVASAHEWTGALGTGVEVKPAGAVTFTSDNPAAVTVDANTGQLAYVAAGVANISFADADNTTLVVQAGSVTVSADVAVSGTVTFA